MQNKPSNTREQCAFDRGAHKAKMIDAHVILRSAKTWADMRDERNPHKKGSVERQFWNDGFDSVSLK